MRFTKIVMLFFTVFLFGCSTTYRVTDFSSKEKFYHECNNNFKDRDVKVTLKNDSILACPKGIEIKGDTLYKYVNQEEKKIRHYALSDIANCNSPTRAPLLLLFS